VRRFPRLASAREWLFSHRQRVAYFLVSLFMTAAVVSAILSGFTLHDSADLERQSLRTEQFAGAVFRIQNFTLEAQGSKVGVDLVRARAQGIDAANAAFDDVQAHDHGEGSRLRPVYLAYLAGSERAFGFAITRDGQIPAAAERQSEAALQRFVGGINDEVDRLSNESHRANPRARLFLFLTIGMLVALIASFILQFTIERKLGRIDRDNAKRTAELIELRDEFVAAVSHELRTPLTSIIGYLELLRDAKPGEPPPNQLAFLEVVKRNADRLLRLVNDLLFVAEIEGGNLAFEFRRANMSKLASQCVDAARPSAYAKSIELTFQDGSAGTEIEGDPVRLAQMMDNLVSNAIKFTPSGGTVAVTVDGDGDGVVFGVSDSGVGISASDQEQLFDRFFRTHSAAAGAAPGTGLGLTITKAIVEAHHGSIALESTVGTGTSFRVRLPRTRSSTEAS
jgi:signal transduction histidine kinase